MSDTSLALPQNLPADIQQLLKQSIIQDQLRALQEGTVGAGTMQRITPRWPSWPTSRPGPLTTPPPAGMRSINPLRPEQVTALTSSVPTTFGEELPLHTLPDPYLEQRVNLEPTEPAPEPRKKPKQRL